MNGFTLRAPTPDDLPDILETWQRSFGDPPELIAEFLREGDLLPGAVAAEAEGRVRSVMFAFEHQRFGGMDAAYLYALCTHPDFRGRGLGGAVVRELCDRCFARGAELVCLSPADDSLAAWYASLLGMRTMLRFRDIPVQSGRCALPLREISPADYREKRGGSFVLTSELLRAQAVFLEHGGFFELDLAAAKALACIGVEGDTLQVYELRCPPEARGAALGALAERFGCAQVFVRTRSDSGTPIQYLLPDRAPLSGALNDDFFFTMA